MNQSLSILDAVWQRTVIARLATPPVDPQEGDAYLVDIEASNDWAGKENQVAVFVAGTWMFVAPASGVFLFDRETDQLLRYVGGWQSATEPASPAGGSVIETEARAAIDGLIQALRNIGVFA